MHNCKLEDTHVVKGDKFNFNQYSKNDLEKKEMQQIPYTLAVESLMYALVCICPDISFIIGMLGWYLNNPGMDHWKATKRVIGIYREQKIICLHPIKEYC